MSHATHPTYQAFLVAEGFFAANAKQEKAKNVRDAQCHFEK